jgi:hypothetical protein
MRTPTRNLTIIPALALGLLAQVASAETINLYTPDGKSAGYARVNPRTGSVDLYKPNGARLGYGKVAPGGNLDLYKPNGERELTGKPAIPSGTGTRSRP